MNRPTPSADAHSKEDGFAAPRLALPKAGGAIHGLGETFAANPVTGTASCNVPIPLSPGRSGFGPQLALSYDSGHGTSAFGFGWALSVPMVTRRTDNGLPRYRDQEESDNFLLTAAEGLVPALAWQQGQWVADVLASRTLYGQDYRVVRYRPRVEGLFARIERWTNLTDSRDCFWRSISKDNVTSWYGRTAESRICDPADATRIFSWLICQSYDDRGNVISYTYKAEDSTGVHLSDPCEFNRTGELRAANRYLKTISYGNRTPYVPDLSANQELALPSDWCFQAVFDYGEHDLLNPTPSETSPWTCREDVFSTYRARFEVRTYRLCRRILMFHHFEQEAGVGLNCLVRSTELTHATSAPSASKPFYSYLLAITQSGHARDGNGGYITKSLPPLEFEYSLAEVDATLQDIDAESLRNLPNGVDGQAYRWTDLNGEGTPGILNEEAGAWRYKANLSPARQTTAAPGSEPAPWFAPEQSLGAQPSLAVLPGGQQQLNDLSRSGQLALIDYAGNPPGFFQRTAEGKWNSYEPFPNLPVQDWRNPNLRFIDLTGDGFADLLISEDSVFAWSESQSTKGFSVLRSVPRPENEETGPRLVFADATETIFLADMSGDGLADLVRIRNGEICYWPNQGFGIFGAKVSMANAPQLDGVDRFDPRRIRLADIDGTGTADLIYFAGASVSIYFNQAGNGWRPAHVLGQFPELDQLTSVAALDLMGMGTTCLVWSSSLPSRCAPMRYINLMRNGKPHLLVRSANNLGHETRVTYTASTRFYVEDKLAGRPWLTRLPFPVQVVSQVESYDYIGRNRFVTRYSYHHGYYDAVEHEFRGFGRVDQWDTAELASLTASSTFPKASNEDAGSQVPPVLTRTWFHTGAYFGEEAVSQHFADEYYNEGNGNNALPGLAPHQLALMRLADSTLPQNIFLPDETRVNFDFSSEELREAARSLRGSVLRREVYAVDGTGAADRPYLASEQNYAIEALQPQASNRYAVFYPHPREAVEFHYERKLYTVNGNTIVETAPPPAGSKVVADPRVIHSLTLSVNRFGDVLQSASIAYGRRYLDPALTADDQALQGKLLASYQLHAYTNAIEDADRHRAPLPSESTHWEILQAQPKNTTPGVTALFGFDEIGGLLQQLSNGTHDLPFETASVQGLNPGQVYRRLLQHERTFYRPDDLGAAAGDMRALLPAGQLQPLALPGENYRLALTPGLIAQVYQRQGTALLPLPKNTLGSVAADGGGYVDLDGDGNWWLPSGRIYFSSQVGSPAQEAAQAKQAFYLPLRFEDPFGNATLVAYEQPHYLLPQSTTDAVGNVVSAANDYRVLEARLLTDANGNRTELRFDALGMVAGTAVMGKLTEQLGDSFSNFSADLSQQQADAFFTANDPSVPAAALLGTATSRLVYDVLRFYSSKQAAPEDPAQWQPVYAASIAREYHGGALNGPPGRLHINFSYSDGLGREIQRKGLAEPGPVVDGGPAVNPRWIGSGWIIYNNKGLTVREYEPFFSALPSKAHQFEYGMKAGVSPIFCYDPTGRRVVTIHPNHTFEKSVFDPWSQFDWDTNDTVLQNDPSTDADVGAYLQRIDPGDYSPTWYAQRSTGALGISEQDAAQKTAAHANTFSRVYFDAKGRTFLNVEDNGALGLLFSRVQLDIDGNPRATRDALTSGPQGGWQDAQGRIVLRSDFDMLGKRIHQSSMEGGEHWVLHDVLGKLVCSWDSRGHNQRATYDALRRPLARYVTGTDATNSDPRTLAGEVLFEQFVYGESQANPEVLNLRTRLFQHFDPAGAITNSGKNPLSGNTEGFDFKGNLLCGSRSFVENYQNLPDWAAPPAMPQSFVTGSQFDALNRVTTAVEPDGTVLTPTYDQTGLLQSLSARLRGAKTATALITNIDYNAKGQRLLTQYGNGAETHYGYDALTYRLARLYTRRGATFTGDCGGPPPPPNFAAPAAPPPAVPCGLQNLTYTYDPAGNITGIRDDAQQTIYFRNKRVEPSTSYTYDAVYRLAAATGRELLGLNGGALQSPVSTSYNDVPRVALSHPNDGNALGVYSESYQFDAAGNLQRLTHRGSDPVNPGWTRAFEYLEPSQLEPGKTNNRLTRSTVGGSQNLVEAYSHDPLGNMTKMPQLQALQWGFGNQLAQSRRQAVNGSDQDGTQHQGERTYYIYGASGERLRKVTESAAGVKLKERLYIGNFEIYAEYDGAGNTTLRRETLHVMEAKHRVLLIETKTTDAGVAVAAPAPLLRFQLSNLLGSAVLELDANAQIISYEEYYPFGGTSYQGVSAAIEVSAKRYRYNGKERDEETGLYYYGARYYAPWLARWTSCDPRGLHDSPNLYVYTRNNPIAFSDPQGMQSHSKTTPAKHKAQGGALHHAAKAGGAHSGGKAPHELVKPHLVLRYDVITDEDYLEETDLTPGSPEARAQMDAELARLQRDEEIVLRRGQELIDRYKPKPKPEAKKLDVPKPEPKQTAPAAVVKPTTPAAQAPENKAKPPYLQATGGGQYFFPPAADPKKKSTTQADKGGPTISFTGRFKSVLYKQWPASAKSPEWKVGLMLDPAIAVAIGYSFGSTTSVSPGQPPATSSKQTFGAQIQFAAYHAQFAKGPLSLGVQTAVAFKGSEINDFSTLPTGAIDISENLAASVRLDGSSWLLYGAIGGGIELASSTPFWFATGTLGLRKEF